MEAFRPDIIVTRVGSPAILLIVEVKTPTADQKSSESQLKSYMVEMNCPNGMVVTPTNVRFYRNRYIDYSPQTIELIGECPTGELLRGLPEGPLRESELEALVVDWLERLRASSDDRTWPLGVREAIESSILPAVSDGIVQAGGPRWRRAG